MAVQVDQIITEFIQRGTSGLRSELRAIRADIDTVEGRAEQLGRVSNQLRGFGDAGAGAFALIGGAALRAKGDMQLAEIGFKKALGSEEAALFQLAETMSSLESNGASCLIDDLTGLVDKTNDFVKQHPGLVKNGIAIAGIAAAGTLAVGAGLKVYGVWRDVFGIVKGGTRSVRGLTDATKADAAAELAKAGIAGKEAAALSAVSDAVQIATGAKGKLAARTAAATAATAAGARGTLSLAEATASYGKAASAAEKATNQISKADSLRGRIAAQLTKTETALKNVKRSKLPTDPLEMVDAQKRNIEETMRLEARRATLRNRLNRVSGAASAAKETLKGANTQKQAVLEAVRRPMSLHEATASYAAAANRAEQSSSQLAKAQATRKRLAAHLAKTEGAIEKAAQSKKPVDPEKSFRLGARRLSLQNRLARVDNTIDAAKSAVDVSKFQKQLALEAAKAGTQISETTKPLSVKDKVIRLWNKPIMPRVETPTPKFALAPFKDVGHFAGETIDQKAWNAAKLAAWNPNAMSRGLHMASTPNLANIRGLGRIFGASGNAVTIGSAATGIVGGITSGYNAGSNMKAAGYTDGQAYMYGAATGIGAAGAAMFLPGGIVAKTIGEAAALVINHFYNERIERETSKGSGLPADVMRKWDTMSGEERTQAYFDQSKAKSDESKGRKESLFTRMGDAASSRFTSMFTGREEMTRADELALESQQAQLAGNSERRRQAAQQKASEAFALNQRLDDFRRNHGINKDFRFNRTTGRYEDTRTLDDLIREGEEYKQAMRESKARDDLARRVNGTNVQARQTDQRYDRNGDSLSTIQVQVVRRESPGDKAARVQHYNTLTPAPNYAR